VGARQVRHFLLPKICAVTVAELLAGFGSKLGELATAVFVIDSLFDDPETFTVMLTVAEAPLAIFPRLQVIVPTCPAAGAVQDAPPELIDTNVDKAGTGSSNVTATARNGPRSWAPRGCTPFQRHRQGRRDKISVLDTFRLESGTACYLELIRTNKRLTSD